MPGRTPLLHSAALPMNHISTFVVPRLLKPTSLWADRLMPDPDSDLDPAFEWLQGSISGRFRIHRLLTILH